MGKLIALKCLFFTIICILTSQAIAQDRKTILAYGDSLFSRSYVHDGDSLPEQLEVQMKNIGFYGDVIGVGNDGFTSGQGLRLLERTLQKYPKIDLAILEFGGNDLLKNIPTQVTFANMEKMITILKQNNISVYIAGMVIPYNGFQGYSSRLNQVYTELAKKHNLPLDPFLLEGVMGIPDLNNYDRVHPNKTGNWVIANRLAPKILNVMANLDPNSKIQTRIQTLKTTPSVKAEPVQKTPISTNKATNILVVGDSLVAGYGLEPGEDLPTQLQLKLREMNPNITVYNAGVSGDTTSGGIARLDWVLSSYSDLDLVIILFGGNDALRGLHPDMTRRNIDKMVSILKTKNIPTLIAGMVAPPNLGQVYGEKFNSIYPDVAQKYDVALYPFYLEGVAGNLELNQPDRIHPNFEGVKKIVEKIAPLVFETSTK